MTIHQVNEIKLVDEYEISRGIGLASDKFEDADRVSIRRQIDRQLDMQIMMPNQTSEKAEAKIYSALKSSPLFAGLSSIALNDILGRMTARSYTTNQYICREGDTSDLMYLLESGAVEVIVGEDSAAQVVAHLRRGDIFGEMGLLSDEPRAASTLTTMPTLVLELDRSAFTEIVHLYPAILLNISRVLIERQKKSLRSLVHSRRSESILLMIGRGTESLAQQILRFAKTFVPTA